MGSANGPTSPTCAMKVAPTGAPVKSDPPGTSENGRHKGRLTGARNAPGPPHHRGPVK